MQRVGTGTAPGWATALVRWLGFINRQEARQRLDATPVKLKISLVDGEDLSNHQWEPGCLVDRGAVVDSEVVILNVPPGADTNNEHQDLSESAGPDEDG